MSDFSSRKKSPTGNDTKRTQGAPLRQQGFHDVNKRRAFLQDNSWIKKRPEEEKDENYGRVVLNRHNSHDALDRKIPEREERKATISRYRSDDTLDRTLSVLRTQESTRTPLGGSFNANTPVTAPTPATTPVKKKRQSWFPPPPPGHNASPNTGASRRDPAVHPPIPPKPCSPIASPKQLRRNNRQIHVTTAGAYEEANRHAEKNIRAKDLDDIIRVAASLQKTDKGEEMDNLIRMSKSLNRNQGLDGLFRSNLKTQPVDKRAQSLESLICMNSQLDRDGKGNQVFGSLKKINQRTDKEKGQDLRPVTKMSATADKNSRSKQDIDGLTNMNPETHKNMKRGQSLDNLIKVTPEVNRSNQGGQNLDNFTKAVLTTNRANQGLDSLYLEGRVLSCPEVLMTQVRLKPLALLVRPCLKTKSNPKVTNNLTDFNLQIDEGSLDVSGNPGGYRDRLGLFNVYPSALTRANQIENIKSWETASHVGNRSNSHIVDQSLENLTEIDSHVSENKNGSFCDWVRNNIVGIFCQVWNGYGKTSWHPCWIAHKCLLFQLEKACFLWCLWPPNVGAGNQMWVPFNIDKWLIVIVYTQRNFR
ncbi:Scel [Phodopus roborovskii]|uniref:Scel protein n=1 Tax=Phodopus roborovskii TaxID=109678 RepID=A0AAU9ZS45_PHORO|nr:Scel [Phodopus roborovskii]